MTFLTVNAFVFLLPMMPEMTQLTSQNIELGMINVTYQEYATKKMMVGLSNVLPLFIMVVLSAIGENIFSDSTQ